MTPELLSIVIIFANFGPDLMISVMIESKRIFTAYDEPINRLCTGFRRCYWKKQKNKKTKVNVPVIWGAMTPMCRHCCIRKCNIHINFVASRFCAMYDVRSHRLLKPKEWDRYLFFNPCHVGSILENEKIYLYFLSFFIAVIARDWNSVSRKTRLRCMASAMAADVLAMQGFRVNTNHGIDPFP